MKAKKGVLNYLNKILTAAHQYLLHGAMCHNWGYDRLHHHIHKRVMDEIHHTEVLMNHILYLEGEPNMQRLGIVNVGTTVSKQLANDLKLEQADLKLLREAIAHCRKVGDFTTRNKLEEMSVETDEHIDWIETQQETIKQVGAENYLGLAEKSIFKYPLTKPQSIADSRPTGLQLCYHYEPDNMASA